MVGGQLTGFVCFSVLSPNRLQPICHVVPKYEHVLVHPTESEYTPFVKCVLMNIQKIVNFKKGILRNVLKKHLFCVLGH